MARALCPQSLSDVLAPPQTAGTRPQEQEEDRMVRKILAQRHKTPDGLPKRGCIAPAAIGAPPRSWQRAQALGHPGGQQEAEQRARRSLRKIRWSRYDT